MPSSATKQAIFSLPTNNYPRMKFLDPTTGRFTSLDPFGGNNHDPQSFNKYGYVHGDPIQGVDPTGKFLVSLGISMLIGSQIRNSDNKASFGVLNYGLLFSKYLVRYVGGLYESLIELSFANTLWEDRVRAQATGKSGKNLTQSLLQSANGVMNWWSASLSDDESDRLTTLTFDNIISQNSMYSFSGWDISPLNGHMEEQRGRFAGGISDWAPRSVTVQGKVYYAHEVNYFIWGVAHAMAAKRNTQHGNEITREAMVNWVLRYRTYTDWAWMPKPNDGTKHGRAAWAEAGWDYVQTGIFNPPSKFYLPNATPNDEVYSEKFTVQLGEFFPSNSF